MGLLLAGLMVGFLPGAGADAPAKKDDGAIILKEGGGQGREYRLYPYQGTPVSENCLDGKCMALRPPPHGVSPPHGGYWQGHPAAIFCEYNDGDYIVVTHPNGNQDGICLFRDSSYMFGWDYFRRNTRKQN